MVNKRLDVMDKLKKHTTNAQRNLYVLLCVFPFFLNAGEFTATVNRNKLSIGESLTLDLSLKETSSNHSPSLEKLKQDFLIHSQQQLSNTVITNGKISSSTIWKVILIPQKEGTIEIPPLSIETKEGELSTSPIPLQVTPPSSDSRREEEAGLNISTELSHSAPYKNQPILYTVKMCSTKDLANVQVQAFSIENAIVESHGEVKTYEKVVNGVKSVCIELNYLITPFKTGALTIPPITLQGVIPIKEHSSNRSIFSMMQGYDRLEPFAISTRPQTIEIQPALADISPWLPAVSLDIEENWNSSQKLEVGEPFTRELKISAEGLKAKQLPHLDDLQKEEGAFKIYADKPELLDEILPQGVKSYRKEQYTIIPQKPGLLRLPEITVAWWDVNHQKKRSATIPARDLQILPKSTEEVAFLELEEQVVPEKERSKEESPFIYLLIGALSLLLGAALYWVVRLQKKLQELKNPEKKSKMQKKEVKPKSYYSYTKEKLNDLNPT